MPRSRRCPRPVKRTGRATLLAVHTLSIRRTRASSSYGESIVALNRYLDAASKSVGRRVADVQARHPADYHVLLAAAFPAGVHLLAAGVTVAVQTRGQHRQRQTISVSRVYLIATEQSRR